MSCFTQPISSFKECKQILSNIYYSNEDAVISPDKNTVYAPSITAQITKYNKGFLVTLSSNFYFESTLKEIVQSALQLN